jgi:superfamily I DNA/RNA helicase
MSDPIRLVWPQQLGSAFDPDASQQSVIDHQRGHLRVLAGPGTGKTSVIVAAVQRRIAQGQSAGEMLVLTYGRMAAEELRQRLSAGGHPVPVATTFHALAYRLLRASEPDLRLLGAPEQEAVLREIVAQTDLLPTGLEPARNSRGLTEQIRAFIAGAQSRGLNPDQVSGDDPITAAAAAIYGEYLDVTGLAATVDYSDLIRRATRLLAEDPPESVRRLRTIFVDEYQDTDPSQVALLQHLSAHGAQIVAVGDPDQSIYGFRGADADGILRFHEQFSHPRCETIALSSTRRFGPQIAQVVSRVVPRNALGAIPVQQVRAHRHPAALGPDGQVAFRLYESEAAQAEHIADLLRRVHAGSSEVFPDLQVGWSQMAVLVRSAARDLPMLQRALAAAGVPAEIVRDDLPVAKAPAVRPLLDVLRVAADVDGGLTADRAQELMAGALCGLQPRQISRLARQLRRQAARSAGGPAPLSTDLLAACLLDPDLLAAVDPELAQPAERLAQLLERTRAHVLSGASASEALAQVWQATSWPQRLRNQSLAGGRRAREANQTLDAVMQLFEQAEQMDLAFEQVRTVRAFLDHLDRQAIPAAGNNQQPWNRNAVRLLTAHRAKGSQWPLVVVAGVQEGLWPDVRPRPTLLSSGQPWREQQVLDERRLFFVACSRASRGLIVTAVHSATDDGPKPSQFVRLAAGDAEPTMVVGRPQRPLTAAGVVAGLRRVLLDPAASPALKQAVWERLVALGESADTQGRPIFPWADPDRWWGHRQWSVNEQPWFDPQRPLALSASSVERYVQCPRRWFLEKRAKADDAASTRMAFGTLLHLCAQAVAVGAVEPDEQQIGQILDEVWEGIGYEPGWQDRFERQEAHNATRRLLTWIKGVGGQFVGAEQTFSVDVDLEGSERVTVAGTVDRVDRIGEQTLITDFKTGKTAISGKEAEQHIQLGLYRWVCELGALGVPSEAVAQLLYLRLDPPQKEADLGAKVRRQGGPDVAEWLAPVLSAAVGGMRAEVAVARPGPQCRTCALCTSCPAVPQGTEVRP